MILTPNQKFTLTLAVGGTLALAAGSGIGSVTRLANPPDSDDPHGDDQFTGSRSYGPYTFLTVWKLACLSGSLSVTGDFVGIGNLGPDATTVSNLQMRAALKDQGKFADVRDYLAADEEDDATAQWLSGAPIQFGDTLSNWIAARLSYGPLDMATLFNLAATKG